MSITKRRTAILLLVLAAVVISFYAIRSFVFSEIRNQIEKKILSLQSTGLNIRYDSISINWRSNSIELHRLVLEQDAYDTTCVYPEYVSIGSIRADGFSLWPLVLKRTLNFENLSIDTARIVVRKNTKLIPDSTSGPQNDLTLLIDNTHVSAFEVTYTDSASCKMLTGVKGHLNLAALRLEVRPDEPVHYRAAAITLDSLEVSLPEDLYTFKIARTKVDLARATVRMDTIRVIPGAGKAEFARLHGIELDRFDALIPFVAFNHVAFSSGDTTSVKAGGAEIQFYLKVFRDKRQPMVKKEKFLPLDQLRKLPFNLAVDSLKIRKSYVKYEEYAEDATAAGMVYFDNLYASLYNINNRSDSGSMKLRAMANLLGQGKINLFVTFPFEHGQRSMLAGDLINFDIPEINAILVPSTNLRVESGKMEKLTFNFAFDDTRSDGEIALQYKDLKLAILKADENDSAKPEKDNLKTFIMNTFIFRTNMDEQLPEEKRTGTVGFVRDHNRSVFNFWVKSLVSGIKSAYNLDKVEEKKSEKEIRKEQRLLKREARKERKAAKKRARG